MTWPGAAPSSAAASSRPAWAAPGLPDGGRAGRRPPCRRPRPDFLAAALLARPWVPATMSVSTRSGSMPASARAAREGGLAEPDVLHLAELLLPLLRALVAGRPPAVEELVGGGARADELGEDRAVGVVADEERGRRVAAGGLVGAAGQAGADVGRDHQGGRAAGQGGAEGHDARAHGAAEVGGDHVAGQLQRGVDGGGVGLVDVGRGRRWRTTGRRAARRCARRARRAASTPRVVVSSS